MRNSHRYASLAAALLALTMAPAWAGDVCDTIDAGEDGLGSTAAGLTGFACGRGNAAIANTSVAIGAFNIVSGNVGVAIGFENTATGESSIALGTSNFANGFNSIVVGYQNWASGDSSSALGYETRASGASSVAVGNYATGSGAGAVALGGWFDRNGDGFSLHDTDLDGDGFLDANSESAIASGLHAVAVGAGVLASGAHSSAFGVDAQATADGSTAIGFGARADRENTVSVGAAGNERQVVNVAAGTQLTDAVNLSQLQSTLATANAYTDTAVATGGTATNAYTDNREAAIRGDLQTGDAATLSSANAYTDTRISQLADLSDDFDALRGEVDRRLRHQDDRIDRAGALGAAMVGMVASAAAVESGQTRIGIAAGSYGGKQALSLGVQRRIGGRAAMTLGGAFSGSERSATVGIGFGF